MLILYFLTLVILSLMCRIFENSCMCNSNPETFKTLPIFLLLCVYKVRKYLVN